MKKIIILLLALCAVALQAQNLDGGAAKLMNELGLKYTNYSTIQIDYTLKSEKEKKVLSSHSGKMHIKGNKYYLTIPGQAFYCDGTTIWNYQKASNEISIYEYDETDDSFLNPAKMLANWKTEYRAQFIREEVLNDKTLVLIDMTPIVQQSYYRIRLFIDKAKNDVVRFAVYEKDNTIHTYYFDKFLTNQPIDDSKFKLNTSDFPNAEINDMR